MLLVHVLVHHFVSHPFEFLSVHLSSMSAILFHIHLPLHPFDFVLFDVGSVA